MEIFFYIIIFIIGTLFGSFYTLAIHRIPRKQDITHTHSYCPKCNNKLGFLDLIPILSYICLGGKCRYCKEKIRPRYLIIEVLSGLTFVAIAYLTNFNIYTLSIRNIIEFIFIALYLTFVFLIGGIDKENKKIQKSVTVYGIVISVLYIVYLYIVDKTNIYRYVIYLIFYIILLILDTITLKKFAKDVYANGILFIVTTMAIFTGENVTINTIILTLLAISAYILFNKIKDKKKRTKKTDKIISQRMSIGYFLALSNIVNIIFVLIYNNYII